MSVYFMQHEGRIKIGWSRGDGWRRAATFPGTLMSIIEGNRRTEARLHARFADLRVGGD